MLEIRRAVESDIGLIFKIEDRRLDSERVVVRPKANGFSLDYKPQPAALWHVDHSEKRVPGSVDEWLSAADKGIYIAFVDGALAGQILVETVENNVARIWDIRVQMSMRRRGVGRAMLLLAADWARHKEMAGLMTEIPDGNAGACQFFTRCDFSFGGIDMLRYAGLSRRTLRMPGVRESALFFYRFFHEKEGI